MKIGILGAGLVGAALAKLMADAGHDVMVSSRHPDRLAGVAGTAGTIGQACVFGDLCAAAIPFGALGDIPAALLYGKVVMDAMNYYPDRDAAVAELDERTATTSELVARHLAGARVVKAFNAILARDLPFDARPPATSGRRALPIAGEDDEAKRIVAEIHDDLGFDVLDAGLLADSWRFERAKPAYCIPLNMLGLRRAIAAATREGEMPHGSWRR